MRHSPKLSTCASPHNWTLIPVLGVDARSAAITHVDTRQTTGLMIGGRLLVKVWWAK